MRRLTTSHLIWICTVSLFSFLSLIFDRQHYSQEYLFPISKLEKSTRRSRVSGIRERIILLISGIEDGDIVAIAIQRKSETTANRTELFSTLEALSGISRVALRDTAGRDAYALVFQKGK